MPTCLHAIPGPAVPARPPRAPHRRSAAHTAVLVAALAWVGAMVPAQASVMEKRFYGQGSGTQCEGGFCQTFTFGGLLQYTDPDDAADNLLDATAIRRLVLDPSVGQRTLHIFEWPYLGSFDPLRRPDVETVIHSAVVDETGAGLALALSASDYTLDALGVRTGGTTWTLRLDGGFSADDGHGESVSGMARWVSEPTLGGWLAALALVWPAARRHRKRA